MALPQVKARGAQGSLSIVEGGTGIEVPDSLILSRTITSISFEERVGGEDGVKAAPTVVRSYTAIAGGSSATSMIRRSDLVSSLRVYGFCTKPTAPASVKRWVTSCSL